MIHVQREPADMGVPHERCCFCRTPTPYWTNTDVACCRECAKARDESEVPTKKQWFAAEDAWRKEQRKHVYTIERGWRP